MLTNKEVKGEVRLFWLQARLFCKRVIKHRAFQPTIMALVIINSPVRFTVLGLPICEVKCHPAIHDHCPRPQSEEARVKGLLQDLDDQHTAERQRRSV